MPRPATLPLIDWKAVFESGLDYAAWLAALPRPVHVVAIAEDWCGDVASARKKVAIRYEQDTARREVVTGLLRLVDIAASREP